MESLYGVLRGVHITASSIALALFWGPIIAPKGGRTHIRIGWAYVVLISVAVVTALGMSTMLLMDPLAVRRPLGPASAAALARFAHIERVFALFAGYLTSVIVAAGWHGLRVLRKKQEPQSQRTPFEVALNVWVTLFAVVVFIIGIRERIVPAAVLSVLGPLIGLQNLRHLYCPPASRMAWWYEHLRSMIPSGIAAYTAFFVFAARRLMPVAYQSSYYWIFWVTPVVVGVVGVRLTLRYYRRKFHDTTGRAAPLNAAPMK